MEKKPTPENSDQDFLASRIGSNRSEMQAQVQIFASQESLASSGQQINLGS